MALDSIVRGVSSGTGAEVNAANELRVALSTSTNNAGYSKILGGDGGATTVTEDGYLLTSVDSLIFYEQVDGSSVNINTWAQASTTMTIAQANGFITLNSGGITTLSTSAQISSIKQIPLYGTKPVRVIINAKVNVGAQSNATMELGIGSVSGTSAPTDGVFFRWSPSGIFQAVINNNGTETTSSALTSPAINDTTLYEIVVVEDACLFYVDDVLVATIANPIGNSYTVNNGHQPVFARTYTAGSAPATAPILNIGQIIVIQQSINQNKLWKEILSSVGRGSYQSPVTAFAQTANFANSTAPTSATLSNTAAGYTTLGGKYQFAAVAGATTDFALFGYQVPTGFQLYVSGLTITCMNTGAAVATSSTVMEWGVGVNSSAVSLATTDGAGTWGPRRQAVGLQGFVTGAAIGVTATDIVRTFDPPLVVDSGRFFHIILQMPVGTATASEIFRGSVMVNGYFE